MNMKNVQGIARSASDQSITPGLGLEPLTSAFCCTYGCTDLFRVSEVGEAL
jgi:hypothetical protein